MGNSNSSSTDSVETVLHDGKSPADSEAVSSTDATSSSIHAPGYRLLTLEGQTGAIFCRVHDEGAKSTIPSRSENGRLEFATRSLLRMFNLTVFRGRDRAGSMVGPADYFGNVERPHLRRFTVDIRLGDAADPEDPARSFARFVAHDNDCDESAAEDSSLQPPETGVHTAVVAARWLSGQTGDPALAALRKQLSSAGVKDPFGGSLFPNPGLLLLQKDNFTEGEQTDDAAVLHLPVVDATALDLRPFRARLVRNDVPFRITDTPLKAKDEFRPVSYDFGERYATGCVAPGAGGLFLETHDFTQTMTPLDAHARGFITLGRWLSDGPPSSTRALELIAVRIPFGWTLIVEAGCMHGDSTFRGLYMMSMTSNHKTMQLADTVFLKSAASGGAENFDLRCDAHNEAPPEAASLPRAPSPIVVFAEPTEAELREFRRRTAGVSFMLQPFSKLSWTTTFYRRFNWFPGRMTPADEATL